MPDGPFPLLARPYDGGLAMPGSEPPVKIEPRERTANRLSGWIFGSLIALVALAMLGAWWKPSFNGMADDVIRSVFLALGVVLGFYYGNRK